MRCPFCSCEETQVKDSRPTEDHNSTRRRRECPKCEQRFTTFERVQLREIMVVKAGDRKQPFTADKIIKSMQIALRKRPTSLEDIEREAQKVVKQVEALGDAEVPSRKIGEFVMRALMELDAVGYIRFASVYRDFREPSDFNDFLEEAQKLQKAGRKKA